MSHISKAVSLTTSATGEVVSAITSNSIENINMLAMECLLNGTRGLMSRVILLSQKHNVPMEAVCAAFDIPPETYHKVLKKASVELHLDL